MFSVTVRDHMMIAHSLRGDVFGPAQRLHGATYVVDATFRSAALDDDNIDIGRAADELHAVVGELSYRNLDDEAAFAGMNTSTEALAQVIADRLAARVLARPRRRRPEPGRDLDRAARVARRVGELRATAVPPGISVYVVVPDGLDDPARPSGGNSYDRRICHRLATMGWSVRERAGPGSWPWPDAKAFAALTGVICGIPDGAVVLVDGLIASTVPEALVPAAWRLRLVVLMHMPLGIRAPVDETPPEGVTDARADERAVLSAAAAVVTTSTWARRWLLDRYASPPGQVHVAETGVDAAEPATGTAAGVQLLCVAAVTPTMGHDLLLTAVGTLTDLSWHCLCVGSLTRDPAFADHLRRQVLEAGIGDRVRFTGPRVGADLHVAYSAAEVLVVASRAKTCGMVVTEALARGRPVVATAVGGLPEALGHGADGSRPGLLVPPGDSAAFAAALRCWLEDSELRQRLRVAAHERRTRLAGWPDTAARLSRALAGVAAA